MDDFIKGRQMGKQTKNRNASLLQRLNDAEMRGWLEGCRFAAEMATRHGTQNPRKEDLTRLNEACINLQDNPAFCLTVRELCDYVAQSLFITPIGSSSPHQPTTTGGTPYVAPQDPCRIAPLKQRFRTLRGPYTDGWGDKIDCGGPG